MSMVICLRCRTPNPPGRIFCSACSNKLDMTNVDTGPRRLAWNERWYIRILPYAVPPLLLLLALPFLLRLWPVTDVVGRPAGTRVDAQRVTATLETLSTLQPNRRLDGVFSEGEINAFFKHGKAEALGYESIRVDAEASGLTVQLIRKERTFGISHTASYEITFVSSGPAIRPLRVRKGHGKLWGSARNRTVRALYHQVGGMPEWRAFAHLTRVAIEADRVAVEVRRD